MGEGIRIHVLGDRGPFSKTAKSLGYHVTVGQSDYLIDCGTPIFQQFGGHGLGIIRGLIITHCHEDHKRWFHDLAIFNKYAPDVRKRLTLFTSEDIYRDVVLAAGPALDRSLSRDSKRVVDIAFEDYVNFRMLGPRARYRIERLDEGNGFSRLRVVDSEGRPVSPERAKVVVSSRSGRQRMIFFDDQYREWVEPESFYSYSDDTFYENDKNVMDSGEGYTIEAIKAPVWHGVTTIGLRLRTDSESVVFSSDTVHNRELWKDLAEEKRDQMLGMSRAEFESASVLTGDINNYIERTWSRERYEDAMHAFDDSVVIHDISLGNNSVHTSYEQLDKTALDRTRTLLTHCPDRMTSEWALCDSGKTFRVSGDMFFEVVGEAEYPMEADIFHKENGKYYVGFRDDRNGDYTVFEKDGQLRMPMNGYQPGGTPKFKVRLYEDLAGRYFPRPKAEERTYMTLPDGKVALLNDRDAGCVGQVVDLRLERPRADRRNLARS